MSIYTLLALLPVAIVVIPVLLMFVGILLILLAKLMAHIGVFVYITSANMVTQIATACTFVVNKL